MTGKILSFDFYPKAVYFECKFWISRSAITQVQISKSGSKSNGVFHNMQKAVISGTLNISRTFKAVA